MISTVVFDMDGVLIDSEPLWREAQIELFGAIGVPLTPELCRQTMGLRIDRVVDHWYERFQWEGVAPSTMVTRVVERMVELVTARGELMPGAAEALSMLGERGLSLGLASSSFAPIVAAMVRARDLEGVFGCIVSGDEVERGKPDPAIYLEALDRLGGSPGQSVAIEDSVPGLRSAKAAGMRCIAVPERGADREAFADADLILSSLSGLDPATLGRIDASD